MLKKQQQPTCQRTIRRCTIRKEDRNEDSYINDTMMIIAFCYLEDKNVDLVPNRYAKQRLDAAGLGLPFGHVA